MGLLNCFPPTSLGFMDLPPEIRLQIYPMALESSRRAEGIAIFASCYYNLASTCHQIRLEALPLVMAEKKLSGKSFEQLLAWIQNGTPQNLAMIRTLEITLGQDCFEALEESPRLATDLCKFVPEEGSLVIYRYGEKFRPQAQKIVGNIVAWSTTKSVNTIRGLWNAFTSFPNIEHLSINLGFAKLHKPRLGHTRFVTHHRPERELILEMLPSAFPNLSSFTLLSPPLPLSYLQHFQHLRHLKCYGYFISKPEITLPTLRSLKYLVKITLEQPYGISIGLSRGSYASRRFCITPEIVSQLNPLESFHIISIQNSSFLDAVQLTSPWISALLSHSRSLKDFKMIQVYDYLQPEYNVIEILNFICTSPIPDMSLQLLLPRHFVTMDPKYLVPPQTEKHVDILAYTPHGRNGRVLLKVNTGKYLPSMTELEARESLYEVQVGQTVLKEKFNVAAFSKKWEKARADQERRLMAEAGHKDGAQS